MAVDPFPVRHAELSVELNGLLEDMEFHIEVDPYQLAAKWTANNDARGYVILGDPATRLPVAPAGTKLRSRPRLDDTLSKDDLPTVVTTESPAPESTAADRANAFGDLLEEMSRHTAQAMDDARAAHGADRATALETARRARAGLDEAIRCVDEAIRLLK